MSGPEPLVLDIGQRVLHVRDLAESLRFYQDLLGFRVSDGSHKDCCQRVKIVTGGSELVLLEVESHTPSPMKCWGLDSALQLRVKDFRKAADFLEKEGARVERDDDHSGIVWDPTGNPIGLYDHPAGEAPRAHRRPHRVR